MTENTVSSAAKSTRFDRQQPRRAPDIRGIYVHVPFCLSKCDYCAFYSLPYSAITADRWLRALLTEMAPWRGLCPKTVYIGGGTPSLLALHQWRRLIAGLRSTFAPGRIIEWTVEANPGALDPALPELLRAAGVNRISLGAQSFHDRELRLLGRPHSAADILRAAAVIRAAGFANLSLDLLAGVPGSSARSWRVTLEQALALQPQHVSVYALTLEENTRLAELAHGRGPRPASPDRQLDQLAEAERILARSGYVRYEISNYARPGFACRHNRDCWRGRRYLGFGPAAASHTGLQRRQNHANLATYLRALQSGRAPPADTETLTPAGKLLERIIFGLRLRNGIACSLAARAGREKCLRSLERDGLTRRARRRWMLTRRGRDLADYAARALLADPLDP